MTTLAHVLASTICLAVIVFAAAVVITVVVEGWRGR